MTGVRGRKDALVELSVAVGSVVCDEEFEGVDGMPYRLGQFTDNVHRRADELTAERRAELGALGMRW